MEAPVPAPAPVGRSRARLRAGGALVALVALLGGVPAVLVRLGTWPITGVPTADQLRDLPSTMLTDGAVLGLVTVLLWALWAVFALSVVVEVAAQLRRRRRRRRAGEVPPAADGDRPRRLGGPVQGLARYLVGSLMMSAAPVLTLGRALPAGAATPATTAVEVEAPAEAAAVVEVVDVVDDTGPDRPAAPEVVIVERGDTAWSLAERHLGDGARWREIWEANRDRAQPDGRTWADPGEDVRPGWVLHLPTGGAGAAEPALPAAADPAPAEA
ncbi:MAG: LysM peptidoglycan-binding domain-containing protein, partial [Acidimicrobiia bacterium]